MAKKNQPPEPQEDLPMSDEEFEKAFKEGALEFGEKPFDFADHFTVENIEAFFRGEATWGKLLGMTMEQAYGLAEWGYSLYEEGRFHDARTIFEGLVIANPYDAYFHNVLGAIFQQLDENELALDQYNIAIDLDPEAVHPYVNRGEMLMKNGQFDEALVDFEQAVKLDPEGTDPSVARARGLIEAMETVAKMFKKVT